jgi:hypothetical protein
MNIETFKAVKHAYNTAKDELLKSDYTWQDLVHAGLKVEAVLKHYKTFNVSLTESKKIIDEYCSLMEKHVN